MSRSKLHHSTEHVYWLDPDAKTDRPILGAVAGTRGALLVEAGNSPAHLKLFLDELAKLNLAPPKFLTATHWHWDHVFGASALDVPYITHRETREAVSHMARLDWSDAALDKRVLEGSEIEFCRDMMKKEFSEAERLSLEIRVPDMAFTTRIDLDLGGVTCQIVNVGGDHGADNSVVYVPEDKLLFVGDCTAENYYQPPVHYTSLRLFPLLDRLLAFDVELYLFGHEPEGVGREDMRAYAERLKTIGSTVERLKTDREAIEETLRGTLASPITADDRESISSFIAGLK